jgi:Flp pilus assembly protein TadG
VNNHRGLRGRLRGDRGSEAIQAAIVTPLLIAFVCMAIAAGRLMAGAAQAAADTAAAKSLQDQGIRCASQQVSVDTGGLNVPVGQVGYVHVTVKCTVDLSDLLLPGAPGHKTLSSSFTSTVDAYRSRQG